MSKFTAPLLCSSAVGLLGAAQFGYAIGVINEPQDVIQADLGLSDTEWSGVVAAFTIFGLVGANASTPFIDGWGRKKFLRFFSLIFVVSGLFQMAAGLTRYSTVSSYALLIVGRIVAGIGAGAASVVVPLYLGEIAPDNLKGAFGASNQLMVTIAILISQAIGLGMSTSNLWGWMFFLHAAMGAVGFLASPVLVESPRWLVSKGRSKEAVEELVKVRGVTADVAQEEVKAIEAQVAASQSAEAPSFMSVVRAPEYRKALIIIVALQIAQQLSGINAVFFYSKSFFTTAGVNDADVGTLAVGAINVLATVAAVLLIDRAGRKPLLLAGALGMLLSAVCLTITLVVNKTDSSPALGIVSIFFVMAFVTFFEVGLGAIPWLIGGELLPEQPRAIGMGLGAGVNWIFTTVIALGFPPMNNALDAYSFVPFAVVLAITLVFAFFVVPETKGRSAREVLASLNGGQVVSKDDVHAALLDGAA